MTKIDVTLKLKIWKDTNGQDLVEYALMAGFLAAASGFTLPEVASSVSHVLSTVIALLGASGPTAHRAPRPLSERAYRSAARIKACG